MSKGSKIAASLAVGAAAAMGVTAWLVAPEKAEEKKKAPFAGANIAHRGLHTKDGSVPENSLAAFRDAVENGYGVEFDVHITADDRLVVFHDNNLSRMCGLDAVIEDMSYSQLSALRLAGTEEKIPLLSQVLSIIGGRTPIVMELKSGSRNTELCERTLEMLRIYSGDVCIESFDPSIVRWWRRNAPEVLRGQLSAPYKVLVKNGRPFASFLLSNVLTNFITRPNFIAYGIEGRKPLTVRLSELMGAMRVAWTSHDWRNEDKNDTVIFEFYRPRQRYKV